MHEAVFPSNALAFCRTNWLAFYIEPILVSSQQLNTSSLEVEALSCSQWSLCHVWVLHQLILRLPRTDAYAKRNIGLLVAHASGQPCQILKHALGSGTARFTKIHLHNIQICSLSRPVSYINHIFAGNWKFVSWPGDAPVNFVILILRLGKIAAIVI